MRILYAEDDVEVRKTICELIQMEYTCEVVESNSGQEAIAILQRDQSFDLVLSDYNMPGGSGGELYTFIKKNQIKVPFLLFSGRNIIEMPEFSTFFEDFVGNGKLLKPATGEELWEKIEYALNAAQYQKESTPEFVQGESFRSGEIDLFLRFNKAPCDVYLRLGNGKFVKIVHRDGINIIEVVQKYYEKGIKELFVAKDDYFDFTDALVDVMTSTSKMAESLPSCRIVQNLETGHQVFKKQLEEFGISPKLLDLAHATVESSIKLMSLNSQLEQLLKGLQASPSQFFSHCLLTSYLSCTIVSKTRWGGPNTEQKLAMASFLHDILLQWDSDYTLETSQHLDKGEMNSEFYNHPLKTAEMVRKIKELPADIDHIIFEHHETPNSLGFPRKMAASSISPLGAVFIIAHECGLELLSALETGPELRQKILTKFAGFYDRGNFKEAFVGLKSILPNV